LSQARAVICNVPWKSLYGERKNTRRNKKGRSEEIASIGVTAYITDEYHFVEVQKYSDSRKKRRKKTLQIHYHSKKKHVLMLLLSRVR